MNWALTFIYNKDSATYLHETFESALAEKDATIPDLLEELKGDNTIVTVIKDTDCDTIIRLNKSFEIRIIISQIYE